MHRPSRTIGEKKNGPDSGTVLLLNLSEAAAYFFFFATARFFAAAFFFAGRLAAFLTAAFFLAAFFLVANNILLILPLHQIAHSHGGSALRVPFIKWFRMNVKQKVGSGTR